jgi:hypothetical protein
MFPKRWFGPYIRFVVVGGSLVLLLSIHARQALAQSTDLRPKRDSEVAQDFPKEGNIAASMQVKRRSLATEAALLEQLGKTPEIEFQDGNAENTAKLASELSVRALSRHVQRSRSTASNNSNSIQNDESIPLFSDYQRRRWTNLGLTAIQEPHCRISATEALSLESTANKVRRAGLVDITANKVRRAGLVDIAGNGGRIRKASELDASSLQRQLGSTTHGPVDMLPALTQMLQAEEENRRGLLVEWLAQNGTQISSTALAQRAIFDLSPQVREAAVTALSNRPRIIYRSVLLAGLRHPWAPVADHAAEALVALQDREAVPELKALVNEPDPAAAYRLPGMNDQVVVRELVRVNHLRNCFLCHAPSFSDWDLVRALVPTPGKALSVQYYAALAQSGDILVRADITYLRQDFSVVQPVAKAAPWPELQRYDFLVRSRAATSEEQIALQKPPATYPQREAVLFALKELSK